MDSTFLVLSLFFPRISLLWSYFISHSIPPNTVPLFGDVALSIVVPRVLILIYIVQNLGFGSWFWIHLIVALIVWGGSSSTVSSNRSQS
jgi:hypothetical protein